MKRYPYLVGALSLLACACNDDAPWVSGHFEPAGTFIGQCETPREGTDPSTGEPFPDQSGSRVDENNWLRSWSNETYFWYDEIVDRDPDLYWTPDYFQLLKTFKNTPAGKAKDPFHFSLSTAKWRSFSGSGVSAGYGVQWSFLANTPPRRLLVALTQPNSPATADTANLTRGAVILEVDGVDVVSADTRAEITVLNAGLFPATVGESHTFSVLDDGSTTPRMVTLVSANVTSMPVQNVSVVTTETGNVGYMLFLDHIATSERALIDAVTELRAAGISDLVLDLRYNLGGLLDIASELSYMIAGAERTDGRTFEQLVFNDKHSINDPVTGAPLKPMPFWKTTQGFSTAEEEALPTLDLPRVFVLTGSDTCSASEAVMNGLRGIDVEVIQIGTTTCGKPYGFYPTDNCGTTYFSIQFQGVNAKGFGDYTEGFSPGEVDAENAAEIPGCSVGDDFGRALGDPQEALFAAALEYRATRSCPAVSAANTNQLRRTRANNKASGLRLEVPAWRQARVMVR